MRILVIEDDTSIATAVARGLGAEGFAVEVAADGDDGLWMAGEGRFDAIILDLMLPGRDGLAVCRALREAGDRTPILMLTARDSDLDQTRGLDTGADDYLTKPFSFAVLAARIRALCRRSAGRDWAPVSAGDLHIDPPGRRVWRADTEVPLTARQFDLLEFLVRRAGRVLTREEILLGVWGFDFEGDPNIVEVYVRRLRTRIDQPFGRHAIETIRELATALRQMAAEGGPTTTATATRMPIHFRGTLRLRLTALAVSVVVAVLVVTSIVLITAQHELLRSAIDAALVERADELEQEVVTASVWPPVVEVPPDEDMAWQIVGADGAVLAASAGLVGHPALVGESVPPAPGGIATRSDPPIDEDAVPYRLLVRALASVARPASVLVARDLEDVLASTRTLTELLAVAIPIVATVLAVLVWLLVGRTLRPVEAIRASVARIGAESLEQRVPQPAGDDEIARLAGTMNEMLERIEEATRRQQRFVADASHELRTPVTRLRTQLEVGLAHPGQDDQEASLRALLAETVSLQRLLDDLLLLARADAVTLGEQRVPIDLDDIVLREARRVRENGRVVVDTAAVSAASVIGEPSGLARLVRNLLDNAERHATSRVTLSLGEAGDEARFLVDDDGPGIPPEQRETIFERFARLDDARSRDEGGSGLGLAIARDIVERHGGSLRVDSLHSPGARFVVELPRAPG